jgi:hypothetical protein
MVFAMPRSRLGRAHSPGIFARVVTRLRGREQMLVRGDANAPILLLSYPRGRQSAAEEISDAYAHTLSSLPEATLTPYRGTLGRLPAMVVVLLRDRNPCGCLGHHHPPGAESRLTRRLKADLGSDVGEIDLAWEAIREWRPQPLSSLAVEGIDGAMEGLHFHSAVLAVLLHELDHLAFPAKAERDVRSLSNEFYSSVMEVLVERESGGPYGMSAERRRSA